MEILNFVGGDITQITPGQCVAYLKKKYPDYYRCMNSKLKYREDDLTPKEILVLDAATLSDVKEKAQLAAESSGNALNNNLRILGLHTVDIKQESISVYEEIADEHDSVRQQYIDMWAEKVVFEELMPKPCGIKDTEIKFEQEGTEITSTLGFVCPTTVQAASLSKDGVVVEAVAPQTVLMAARVADLCVSTKGSWKAKPYNERFFKGREVYAQKAAELAHMLNQRLKPDKESLRGVGLVGYLGRQFTSNLRKEGCKKLLVDINNHTSAIHGVKAPSVCFSKKMGDFEQDTVEYALAVNRKCQTIRGGDRSDNSVTDSSYYCGYALERRHAKAFIFSRDIQRLFDQVSMPLKFVGKDVAARVAMLSLANTFYGVLAFDCVPDKFEPVQGNQYLYKKDKCSFYVSIAAPHVAVHFSDMGKLEAHNNYGYAVQYVSYDSSYSTNALICTSVHSMACFISIGNTEIKLHDISKLLQSWITLSIEVNRSRTFLRHYRPFVELATGAFKVLVPQFRYMAQSIRNVIDNYAELTDDSNYISSILAATMTTEDYVQYMDKIVENVQAEGGKTADGPDQPVENEEDEYAEPAKQVGSEVLDFNDMDNYSG